MDGALVRRIADALPAELPEKLGVAVSGGGDSVALLLAMAELSEQRNFTLFAVTIDHQLRAEAAQEAIWVSDLCARLGVPHKTLRWEGWNGSGNLQNAAREARYRLISAWAQERGLGAVLLGHTMDDQAETVLMRLARGSGVDGLSAMSPRVEHHNMIWLRPLLGLRRAALRDYVQQKGQDWLEDASNADTAFDRIRMRHALPHLQSLGLDVPVLAQVAENMHQARLALEAQADAAAARFMHLEAGGLWVCRSGFESVPQEIQRRLAAAAVIWIGGLSYPPRGKSLHATLNAVAADGRATLGGCVLLVKKDRLWITREYNAVREMSAPPDASWDGRWQLAGPGDTKTLRVAALGSEGLAQCKDWRASGLPRDLLLASPAVWEGDNLRAAPLAGKVNGWQVRYKWPKSGPIAAAIAH
jgi:tRNA(Ile)-lysidine synthase